MKNHTFYQQMPFVNQMINDPLQWVNIGDRRVAPKIGDKLTVTVNVWAKPMEHFEFEIVEVKGVLVKAIKVLSNQELINSWEEQTIDGLNPDQQRDLARDSI